jgi:hypothetical protein
VIESCPAAFSAYVAPPQYKNYDGTVVCTLIRKESL